MPGRKSGSDTIECRLLRLIYDAAVSGEGWEEAFAACAKFCGARAMWLAGIRPRTGEIPLSVHHGAPAELTAKMAASYGDLRRNPILVAGVHRGEGVLFATDDVLPRERFERTEVYRQVLVPYDVEEMLGVNLICVKTLYVGFSAVRGRKAGPFTDTERNRFLWTYPHLRRAVQIRMRLMEAERHGLALEEALERLASAVVLVTSESRVVFANRSARRILDQRDGLMLQTGKLVASRKSDDAELQRLVGSSSLAVQGRATTAGGEMIVTRPSGLRPYALAVAPLISNPVVSLGQSPIAAILLHDPETTMEPSPRTLQRLYGLTPAEAKVCVALAHGTSLRRLAENHRVTLNTARTHLYRAMEKTGTRRQTDLVRLLLAGPLRLEPGAPARGVRDAADG
ncbi:MAG: helix-turn-helix transcriptional regulator [Deltaproteobacteria bacterium]|nr:helix-turn-helix transcriptional regulator [Deltaproteobacteria bacterium]